MNLDDYTVKMRDIIQDEYLKPDERHAALLVLAQDIERCAWQPRAQQEARALATQARVAADNFADGGLDALMRLATKGVIRLR